MYLQERGQSTDAGLHVGVTPGTHLSVRVVGGHPGTKGQVHVTCVLSGY